MPSEFPMDSSLRSQPGNLNFISQLTTDPHLLFIALVPFYLLVASSNWIFSPPETIDPWVYHGYFRNLQEYKTALFPGTYYGSRLSWILPGYLAYKVLPPMAANYALHFGLWYTAVFALCYALKTIASRQVALITGIFMGSYTFFLYPVGSDYVDGPANAYFLVCLAFLTTAARKERARLPLFFAGVSYAAVVYANLFTAIFAPVIALYFAVLSYRSREPITIRAGLRALAWFLSGSAALTVFLAFANYLIEGKSLFYLPSVYYALSSVQQPNPWKLPAAEWVGRAEWLLLGVVVAVSGLVALGSRGFRASLAGPAAVSAFLFTFLLMILCEWKGIPVLQYSYYASYLHPTMFLAIGALLERPLQRITGAPLIFLALGVLLLNTIPLWGANAYLYQLKVQTWPAVPLLFGAVFMICALLTARAAAWGIVAALVGCYVTNASTGYAFADRHVVRDCFARIALAGGAVDAVRHSEPVRFWYSLTDPHFAEFNALNSIYLWGYTLLGNEFPAIMPTAILSPGMLVVIPASSGDILSPANETLKEKSLATQFVDRRDVSYGAGSYSLWFVRVEFDYSRLRPLTLQPCVAADCNTLVDLNQVASADMPLDGWVKCEYPDLRSGLERKPDGVHITTVPARFGYAAKYGPLVPDATGRYIFRLRYGISSGGITFGALSGDESSWLGQATIPASQPADQTAVLSLEAEAGQPFWLMTANNHPVGDHASDYVIRDLKAYLFPAQETGTQAHSANQ